MKKEFLLATVCCLMMACNGANTKNESNGSKTETESSESSKATEAKLDPKIAEAFTMQDGKIFDLKGNVKKCVIYDYYSDAEGNPTETKPQNEISMEFSTDGKIVKHSLYEKFFRDDNGQFLKMTWFCNDFETDIKDSFVCDETGFPIKEITEGINFETCVNEFNANKELVKLSATGATEDAMESQTDITYKILERDEKGNWTKRLLDVKDGSREAGATQYDWNNYNGIQIRKIEYHM